MKKTAIIIIGEHASGKSRLINQFVKKKLGMTSKQRLITIKNKRICIKSQTLQEADWDIDDLNRYGDFDILILPSWPKDKGSPTLSEIVEKLRLLGYVIKKIQWDRSANDQRCKDISKEISMILME